MGSARDAFGLEGEEIASRHLASLGLRTIASRARTKFGEIDLVCLDGAEVVFVEVKTRRGAGYGFPEGAVTWRKRQHLRATAVAWLGARGWGRKPYRIDVVSVMVGAGGVTEVLHLPAAVGEVG